MAAAVGGGASDEEPNYPLYLTVTTGTKRMIVPPLGWLWLRAAGGVMPKRQ